MPGPVKVGRRHSDLPRKPRLDPKEAARRVFIAIQERHGITQQHVVDSCGLKRQQQVAEWRSPDKPHLPNLAHLSQLPREMAIDIALYILREAGAVDLADAVLDAIEAKHEAAAQEALRRLEQVRALRGCG